MAGIADFHKQPPRLSIRWRADIGDHVISLAWSPDGKNVAAAAVGGPITVFDPSDGKPKTELPGHGFGTTVVQWRDSQTLGSAGQDGKASLWDVSTHEKVSMMGGAGWVEHLAWSPNREFIATGAGKKLRLFDANGKLVREYPDHGSTISGISWRPNGGELTSSSYGRIALWPMNGDTPLKEFTWRGSVLSHLWTPNGALLATGDQDATVHYWNYASGHHLQMSGYPTKVRELSWDTTNRWMATGGGWMVSVWDCSGRGPEGRNPVMLEAFGEEERVTAIAYQATGPHLAVAGTDGRVLTYRPEKSGRILSQVKLDAEVTQLAWSPGDTKLLVGTARGEVVLLGI